MPEKTRIFCHCHVYYPELWPQLRGALKNLLRNECTLHLELTVVTRLPEVEADCVREFPGANISVVPNRGYDILPFFRVWERCPPGSFDLILKLHTKRDYPQFCCHVNGFSTSGAKWRDRLLEFLSTPENAAKSLRCFDDPRVGMVGNGRLWTDLDRERIDWNREFIGGELRHLGMTTAERAYLAGTMFLCRPRVLEYFRGRIDYDRLAVCNDHDVGVIHCYEMLFGCALAESGMHFCDYAGRPESELRGGLLRKIWFRALFKLYLLMSFFKPTPK